VAGRGFRQAQRHRADFRDCGVEEDLPDLLKTCVFRVLQEALNNCEKHSERATFTWSCGKTPEAISLEVRDDGRGFAPVSRRRRLPAGLGLLGMRERASRLGGYPEGRFGSGHGTDRAGGTPTWRPGNR